MSETIIDFTKNLNNKNEMNNITIDEISDDYWRIRKRRQFENLCKTFLSIKNSFDFLFLWVFLSKKKKKKKIRKKNDDLNENKINEIVLFTRSTKKKTRHLTRFLSILMINKFNEKLSNNQKLQLKTIRMIVVV